MEWDDPELTPEEQEAVQNIASFIDRVIDAARPQPMPFDASMAPHPAVAVKAVMQKFPTTDSREGCIYTLYLNNQIITAVGGGIHVPNDNASLTTFLQVEYDGYLRTLDAGKSDPQFISPDRMVWVYWGERPSEQTDFMRTRNIPRCVDVVQVSHNRIWSLMCNDPQAFPPGGVDISVASS